MHGLFAQYIFGLFEAENLSDLTDDCVGSYNKLLLHVHCTLVSGPHWPSSAVALLVVCVSRLLRGLTSITSLLASSVYDCVTMCDSI